MRRTVVVLAALSLLALGVDAGFAAKKGGKAKKPKKAASSASGGFGKSAAVAAGPTAAQLLKTSMEQYEELERLIAKQNLKEAEEEFGEGADEVKSSSSSGDEDADRVSVTKWCIALRTPAAQEFSDWVPVALIALGCGDEAGDPKSIVPSALGACCREVVEGASQDWPSLKKVGRETMQYSFEPLDSFESHVYEGMTTRTEKRQEAATTLGLESGWSAGDVKKAHRKAMMDLHPDKFIGEGGVVDEEGAAAAKERMNAVQEAYGTLGGGQGAGSGSFYEAVGGKARTEFSGALVKEMLSPLGKVRPEQSKDFGEGGWRAGIVPMTQSVTKEFVTRNLLRKD